MKASDKGIILGVVIAVVLVGFYVKVLSPKREKASKLSDDISKLQSSIDQQKQVAAFAEDARQHFPTYYGRLVVLGKAVPDQADTASMLVQLNSVANRTGVKFSGLTLAQATGGGSAGGSTAAASPSASGTSTTPSASGTSTTSTTPSASGTSTTSTTPSTSTPASAPSSSTTPTPATEASAANVPIGSSVGPGGLSTLPYGLSFQGSFFDITNFFSGLDSLIDVRDGGAMVSADGRLMTVDGFSLSLLDTTAGTSSTASPAGGSPQLQASLAVTTYVTPSDQGLTAGASPSGPAPSVSQPETQTTSATVSP
jgi:Tfp pilus assembly protein PilO